MARRDLLLSALLAVGLTTASPATPLQWSVELADPARPGRQVTALLVGPAAATDPCPVAVLGHATLTEVQSYLDLADQLAQAGWLVALPTTEGGLPGDQGALAGDLLFLGRLLRDGSAALPAELPPVDPGPFALLGHSLGGGAAVLAAADAAPGEVGAVAVMAPQERPRPSMISRAALVTVPTLILAGELDCITPPDLHQVPLFLALGSELKALCSLQGGGHCAFAAPAEPCAGSEAAGCPPELDWMSQQQLCAALVLPWLQWQVRGDAVAEAGFMAAANDPGVQSQLSWSVTAAAERQIGLILRRQGPSPAAGTLRWRLELPAPARVDAAVFDVRGRQVAQLIGEVQPALNHNLWWNGTDHRGRRVPAGLYLLRITAGDAVVHDRFLRLD